MARQRLPRPTEGEWEILCVLWERGPSTVREVYDVLRQTRPVGYTSVLKLLQVMREREMVARDDSQRAHVWRGLLPREPTQQGLVRSVLERFFGGSHQQLVLQALDAKPISSEELEEIRRLLDDYGKGKS
jgi:predicted transcriptional regulator